MKAYFLKVASAAAVLAFIWTNASAQAEKKEKTERAGQEKKEKSRHNQDVVIIKPKGNKDTKFTIEIKEDGEVKVNGKPLSEFKDDNVSISKRKQFSYESGDMSSLNNLMGPQSRFRGGTWNFSGDQMFGLEGDNNGRPFLGVTTEKVDEGAKITNVTEGSSADKAGLKEGDIINRINDEKIGNPEDLIYAIRKLKPEEKVTVTYKREGKEQKATATLGKRNGMMALTPPGTNFNFRNFNEDGFGDANVFNMHRGRLGLKAQETDDGKGLKVLSIDDESPAEKAGIKEGDIITEFDGAEVNNIDKLRELAKSAISKPSIKVKLTRDGKSQDLEIKIPKNLKTTNL